MSFGMKGLERVEVILASPMQKLAKNRYLSVINDGVGSLSFVILVSSLLMVLAHVVSLVALLPRWSTTTGEVLSHMQEALSLPFRAVIGFMSIYVTYEVGYLLAERYKLWAKLGGILSLLTLLMVLTPRILRNLEKLAVNQELHDGSTKKLIAIEDLVHVEQWLPFGVSSLVLGVVLAIIVVEFYRFCQRFKPKEEKFSGIMRAVIPTMVDAIPVMIVMVIMTFFVQIPLDSWTSNVGEWLLKVLFNNPVTALLITFFMNLFWLVGLHGDALVGPWIYAGWFGSLVNNGQELASGLAPSHPISSLLWEWFINLGGTGGTLGLALLLFTARSQRLRSLAKVSILPSLFNINEAIIFGIPIVLNPYFVIPFLLGPSLVTIITYVVMLQGWVTVPFLVVPWTLPSPIGAFLSTMDIRALMLNVGNIIVLSLVYLPFFIMYDRKLLREEVEI